MPFRNLFQGQLDAQASPLLTTPTPKPLAAPTSANLTGLGALPGLQGLPKLPGLLVAPGGGGARSTRPGANAPAKRQAQPSAPIIPPSPDQSLRSKPAGTGWVNAVAQQAKAAGVPPDLAVAIALEESGGDPRAVGDKGSSYGLFQLHKGGALGNLTPQQAFDPATNAGVVLRAWGKLGAIPKDPQQALMQYYSQVGRGSSNEIPTQRAMGKLAEARALLGGQGGQPTLAQSTLAGGAAGLNPKALSSLLNYAMGLQRDALQGKAPDLHSVLKVAQSLVQPTQEVQAGYAPPTDPGTGPRQTVVNAALQEIGVPYAWGGGGPAGPSRGIAQGANTVGFDCSSLIQYVWAKAGVTLPRTTYQQIHVGQPVPNLASAQPGDLLFPHAGHVMLYVGGGEAVESPHTGASVREVSVAGRQFMAIRRPG